MNIGLHVALSDITDRSGMKIIEAIIADHREAKHWLPRPHRVQKSKAEIADSLQGSWERGNLFIIAAELEAFKTFQKKRAHICYKEIEALLQKMVARIPAGNCSYVEKTTKRSKRKNAPSFDVYKLSIPIFGVKILFSQK